MRPLRFLTYLSPSIPAAFFDLLVTEIGRREGRGATLDFETTISGPSAATDPFAADRADFAFVCSPALPELRRAGTAELVGAAALFADRRARGRPVYFSDVVVAAGHPARSFSDLKGGVWTYNDPASLSGWHSLRAKLVEMELEGGPARFFREVRVSGSHGASLEQVADGQADASAIDSNALQFRLEREPALAQRLRVLESWGPLPIQPLLARASLDPALRERVAGTLLALHSAPDTRARLREHRVRRFMPVDSFFYDSFPLLGGAAAGQESPL